MEIQVRKYRRKRDGNERRDFVCKCGRSYLSYPAIHTHIKQKHHFQIQQHLQAIGRPQRQPLGRGRPKKKKLLQTSVQSESLQIVEEAILKIYSALKCGQNLELGKIILQGNQEVTKEQLDKQYNDLVRKKAIGFNLFENPGKYPYFSGVVQFQSKINKHFSVQIAAKIRWYLNYLVSQEILAQQIKQKDWIEILLEEYIQNPLCVNVFNSNHDINQTILLALKKWTEASVKRSV